MSFSSKMFPTSNKIDKAVDLSVLKCDVHSHLIPGIDDGAKTIEESVALVRALKDLGYSKIITTPHILTDTFHNTPEIISAGLENLKVAVKNEGIDIQIEAAAEYYFDFDFKEKIINEKLLSFGKKYILFEISYINPPDNFDAIIFHLQTNGYKPVLAHPERYLFWSKKFEKYEQLKEKGVFFQLNINSLTGYYLYETKKIAMQLIAKNMIEFLGSDCHHSEHINLIKSSAVYKKALHNLVESGRLLNKTL